MPQKIPQPLLETPADQINNVEQFKRDSHGIRGDMAKEFADFDHDDIQAASEQLAKSHGIYLEYNRAKTGKQKDWVYMIRVSVSGGGPLDAKQWRIIDQVANDYCIPPVNPSANPSANPPVNPIANASVRVTNRQNVQFHWVKKQNVVKLIQRVAQGGYFTLNGCGDNVRNVMACPLSRFSTVCDGNALAHQFADYFRLPAEPHVEIFGIDTKYIRTPEHRYEYGPQLLNRKFKIGIAAVHQDQQTGAWQVDNCVELRTHDLGVAPVLENDQVNRFMLYVGGGQGEKNGKPTFATLGQPLGVVSKDQLLQAASAIVKVHDTYGDRKNRHWARLKYVIHEKGIPWFASQVKSLGIDLENPIADFDPGPRQMHHGWQHQPSNGKWSYGAYIENGRLVDGSGGVGGNGKNGGTGGAGGGGRLKTMVGAMMDKYDTQLMFTPNQDLLFNNIETAAKEDFEADLASFGYGKRRGKAYSSLRLLSGACVGLDTCRLAYTDSEKFEPELLDTLDQRGYGDLNESIGITGCERQCFRPATKTLAWVGQGPNMYMLKLGGSETGHTQGIALTKEDKLYLRQVPRDKVADVCAVLFDQYQTAADPQTTSMGQWIRQMGITQIIDMLISHEVTAPLMEKTHRVPFIPDNLKF